MIKFIIILFQIIALLVSPAHAALRFDGPLAGANDDLNCGSASSLDNIRPLTASAWIRPFSEGEGEQGCIVGKRPAVGGQWAFRFGTSASPASVYALRFVKSGTTNLVVITNNNVVTPGIWQHVAVTWNGGTLAANVHIFVNGAEVGYQTQTNGVAINTDAALEMIIGNSGDDARTFDGDIAEVALWNAELSPGDLKILSSGVARMPLIVRRQKLRAYWPLDDCKTSNSCPANIRFKDYSGYRNHCSQTGTPENVGSKLTYP